nr:hypothetical protein BaRGS_008012 [Batillaria attramentaria]
MMVDLCSYNDGDANEEEEGGWVSGGFIVLFHYIRDDEGENEENDDEHDHDDDDDNDDNDRGDVDDEDDDANNDRRDNTDKEEDGDGDGDGDYRGDDSSDDKQQKDDDDNSNDVWPTKSEGKWYADTTIVLDCLMMTICLGKVCWHKGSPESLLKKS